MIVQRRQVPTYRVALWRALLRIRPAQIGDLLKRSLFIQRIYLGADTGHIFWIDPVSVFGLELLRRGVYEPVMTELLQVVLREDDVFIDVGANEGYFSVIAGSLTPRGRVYAIEPQHRLARVLEENIRSNGLQNVAVHEMAFFDRNDEVVLFLRPSTNTGASSLYRHWRIGVKNQRAQATTLDTFFNINNISKARLVKLDCEGAEPAIIRGGRHVLGQNLIDFIALDYHPQICGAEQCQEAHDTLLRAGYVLSKVNGLCVYHLRGIENALSSIAELRAGCPWRG